MHVGPRAHSVTRKESDRGVAFDSKAVTNNDGYLLGLGAGAWASVAMMEDAKVKMELRSDLR